jgi:sigma-B regulation protein RsbU (phosphoserine phosphatase)
MVHSVRTFWQRISDGIEVQHLWMQFNRDARASYAMYSTEVDSRLPDGHSRWARSVEVGRILFWAMILQLSPGRRVLFLLSLVVLAVPLFTFRYQGLTFWGGAGLLILFALELADRVMMKRDLEIAREIQNSMMPTTPPAIPGVDIAFESRAANSVGGDYYDVVIRSSDLARGVPERVLFLVADVAGKGVPAALLMATLQASLRALAGLPISLLELTERLNQYVCTQNVSGRRFSTAFIAELELGNGRLTYVNAGHNWPVLRRSDSTLLERLETGGVPLGIMPSARYECGSTSLAAGDVLLIFSDGLIEAEDDAQQEFGEPGMLAQMENACDTSAADVLAQLLRSVDLFVGPARQHDDITSMVVRMCAPA